MNPLFDTYQDQFEAFQVPKGTSLLNQGDTAPYLYWVTDGYLRLWYNQDGDAITIQFFGKGQFVSSLESFYQQRPSRFSLEAVSPVRGYRLPYAKFRLMLDQDGALKDWFYDQLLERFATYVDLFLSRIKDSPQDRYLSLRAEYPELLDQIPHYMLASYFGITPVSLSRIRGRLNENDDTSD